MIRAFLVSCLMAVVLSGCGLLSLFNDRPAPVVPHDPVRTMCGAIGLIHWRPKDTTETVKQIKVHNEIRRTMCPPDRYHEWYYDGPVPEPQMPAF